MSHRFQIQDIVAQDALGVTFRALDVETGQPVAVRRFFPFGADGGGLLDEERAAYDLAVARLAGVQHPGLRAVLTGGCDPVDGMPFVVTEWVEGQPLADLLEHGVFSPAATIRVLDRALEISEALSAVLGQEALWVETSPALIIEDGGETRRGLTFSICPVKWLGGEASRRSLAPLAELAEELLGWRGLMVPDQAGNGLGSWVNWLRANEEILTLVQARESLAGFAGMVPLDPARPQARPPPPPLYPPPPEVPRELPQPAMAAYPVIRKKKSATKEPLVLIGLLVVLLGAAGWWVTQQAAASRARRELLAAAPLKPRLAAESKSGAASPAPAAAVAGAQPPPVAPADNRSGVFQSGETERIMREKDREVTVEGVLKNIRASDSGKTLYLEFVETTPQEEVRGCVMTKHLAPDMSEQALKPLLGKRIRITGIVRIWTHLKAKIPEVLLPDRKSIREVE